LQKVLRHDLSAVQKHKATVLECLKENDLTIKKLALDLLYLITNESNVKSIVKEMLNYLLVAESDFIQDLTWKVKFNIFSLY
jgi:AP-1 complex subunit gamma-1